MGSQGGDDPGDLRSASPATVNGTLTSQLYFNAQVDNDLSFCKHRPQSRGNHVKMPTYPHPTAALQHIQERVTEYLLRSYPVRDLPLNIRPAMVFMTATWLLLLGILGIAPLPELPVNDKALHFFGLGFATFLFYFIIEVPDGPGKRIWYIRRAPLLLTLVASFFFGGIVSEFIQSLLPWKEFQFGDIVANLLGSTIFLYIAHMLHKRSRRRSERQALYQPLDISTYRDAQGREHRFNPDDSPTPATVTRGRTASNVWDDEESDTGRGSLDEATPTGRHEDGVFDIGDDDPDSPRHEDV